MATKQTIARREYHRQHHAKNRDEFNKRSRAWYYAHRKQVLADHKERMLADPEYAEKIRRKDRRNYRLRQAAKKSKKNISKNGEESSRKSP